MNIPSAKLKKTKRSECGAILILTVILLPVLLGFIGLNLDLTRLFLTKLRLQTAVDNALMYTPLLVVATDLELSASSSSGLPTIQQILEARVRANVGGLYSGADLVSLDVSVTNTSASADVKVRESLFIAPAVMPSLSNLKQMEASAAVSIPRVNFVGVVDCSRSMTLANTAGPAGQSRLETALGAFTYLGQWLRPATDRMAIVSTNLQPNISLDFETNGFTVGTAQAALWGLACDDWTNIADGLEAARALIDSASVGTDDLTIVGLFTDGDIQHSTLKFANASDSLPGSDPYHVFVSRYQDVGGVYRPVGVSLRRAPLTPDDAPWESRRPNCDERSFTNAINPPETDPDLSDCWNGGNIQVEYSGGVTGTLTPNMSDKASVAQALWEAAYLETISEGDALRDNDVKLYVLGVGRPSDSFQAVPFGLSESREDFTARFMQRLTLSPHYPDTWNFPTLGKHADQSMLQNEHIGDYFLAHTDVDPALALQVLLADSKFRLLN